MQQMAIVEELYEEPQAAETVESTEPEWTPDMIDKWYIGLRTMVPSWMILACGVIGAVTLGCIVFKRQIKGLLIFWGDIIFKTGARGSGS